MTTNVEQRQTSTAARTGFSRVLVGIDESAESREAARQASILTDGSLTLLAVYERSPSVIGAAGAIVPVYDEELERDTAKRALRGARHEHEELRSALGKVAAGIPWDQLLQEAERGRHTLVAVGTRGHGRMAGIILGSTATELIHKAPCSVLVARKAATGFPQQIVVAVDGSPESAAAYAAAQQLAETHGARLWPVVAHGGHAVDEDGVGAIVGYHREGSPDEPVRALVTASRDADLLVVGSRGLHGLESLGSVSERVAHEAACSVLVVRGL